MCVGVAASGCGFQLLCISTIESMNKRVRDVFAVELVDE